MESTCGHGDHYRDGLFGCGLCKEKKKKKPGLTAKEEEIENFYEGYVFNFLKAIKPRK